MPTRVRKLSTGAIVYEHTCEVCRKPAYVGYNFKPIEAFKAREQKDPNAYMHLGRWFCMKCDKKENQ